MRIVSNKTCKESQNKHFMFSINCPKNIAIYVIMWRNIVQPDRTQMTIQYGVEKMRLSCRTTKV